jgi:hypothetical protein
MKRTVLFDIINNQDVLETKIHCRENLESRIHVHKIENKLAYFKERTVKWCSQETQTILPLTTYRKTWTVKGNPKLVRQNQFLIGLTS